MIDEQGFRANIGIILCNQDKQLLWARRVGQQDAWQFPQGGIREEESPEQALYRELHEEIGLREEHVEIIASTRDWLSYLLPEQLIRHERQPLCIGQKQRWYLLRLTGADQDVRLDMSARPEFDQWRWVDFWHPLKEVVSFKHEVYESALKEFEGVLFPR